jgi:CSLREA domain-containing protein
MRRTATGFCCAAALALATAAPAAATIDVTSFADDNGAGCTLREAVQSTNTNANVGGCVDVAMSWSEIELDAGTYTLGGPDDENVNVSGDLDISGDLRIVGAGAGATTIDGNDNDRVLDLIGVGNYIIDSLRIVDGNSVADGGAIQAAGVAPLTLAAVSLESNHTDSDGGAVMAQAGVLIQNSTFTGNTASNDGGALELTGTNVTYIDKSLLSGNSSGNNVDDVGGAIDIYNNALFEISNTTLSGNSAPGGPGGAIYVDDNAGAPSYMLFATVAGNSTGSSGGGGIDVDALSVNVRNTILAGNTNLGGVSNCGGSGSVVTDANDGYSLEDANSCELDPGADNLVNTDPQIAPLADNGGGTSTRALYAGSPAIDAVPTGACVMPQSDQREVPRPVGGACDIGAFEGSIAKPPTGGGIPVPTPPAPPAKKCKKPKKKTKKAMKKFKKCKKKLKKR